MNLETCSLLQISAVVLHSCVMLPLVILMCFTSFVTCSQCKSANDDCC